MYISYTFKEKKSVNDLPNDAYAMFLCCLFFCCFFFCFLLFLSDFLYKNICCQYSFEVHPNQMSTHNICLDKEVDKKHTGCNLKTLSFRENQSWHIMNYFRKLQTLKGNTQQIISILDN